MVRVSTAREKNGHVAIQLITLISFKKNCMDIIRDHFLDILLPLEDMMDARQST